MSLSVEAEMKRHAVEVRARLSTPLPTAKPRRPKAVIRHILGKTLPPAPPPPISSYMPPEWVWANEVEVALSSVPPKQIIREVCRKHGLRLREVMSGMRMVPIVAAKREIIWRMRQETLVNGRQISLLEIGQRMGLDHTTVLHHIRKYQAMHDGGLIAKR